MRTLKILATVFLFVFIFTISSYAGTWKKDSKGWWYLENNGSWPANTWQWIDGNSDGRAECYCFDGAGYCMLNRITPDGYVVNSSGAWTVDGNVKIKDVGVYDQSRKVLHGVLHYNTNKDIVKELGMIQSYVTDYFALDSEMTMYFELDSEQEFNLNIADDSGKDLRKTRYFIIDGHPELAVYNRQYISLSFNLEDADWPTDVRLPVGAPSLTDVYLVN